MFGGLIFAIAIRSIELWSTWRFSLIVRENDARWDKQLGTKHEGRP
jgi:hypothetical protein